MVTQLISWAEIAQKFLLPVCALAFTGITGWTATELTALRNEITDLKVQMAEIKTELRLHREER